MNSSKPQTLTSVYNAAITRPPKVGSAKRSPSLKPSMLGSPCMRKIYYSFNKVDEDYGFPLKNARKAELGTAIGGMLAETFYKAGIGIKYRNSDGTIPVERGKEDPEFRISSEELVIKLGKIDLVCILDGKLWICEFKSINDRGFRELVHPHKDHLYQGVSYLYMFNKFLKEGKFSHIPELANFTRAEGCRFLYYSKDQSEFKEFDVTVTEKTFVDLVTKVEELKWYSANEELPPPTPDYCPSCPWRKKCQNNQKS